MESTNTYSVENYEHYRKNGDKNYFEEVIDALMLERYSEEEGLIEYIGSLTLDRKRLAILSLLGGDNNLWLKIKALTDKNIKKIDHIKDIILMLREYVKVGEVEKKKFGEVMTPLELVKKMMYTLPDEVWSNPNLKWLDPANGTGPYPAWVIYRLMVGLKDWEPDEEKRYRHIVENMIYVAELQPKNMFLYMCAVDPFDTYKLNVYTGSFLDEGFDCHMKEVWGIDKFDIVMGNPPYNQMIDMDFVKKSYKISDKTLFVHPSTWLLDEKGKQKKFNTTKELIKDHLESIELFNGNKIFNISLFVPCVITYINKSKVVSDIKCLDRINDIEILYNTIFDINKYSNTNEYASIKEKVRNRSITNNLLNNKNKLNGNFFVNTAQIRGHVDLNSHKNMLLDDFYTFIPKDTKISNENKKHMFFSFDSNEKAENFLKYLKTDFARFCLSIFKSNSQLDRGELEIVPYLDFSKEWTDKNLYEFFGINEEEIEFIKNHIPKYY